LFAILIDDTKINLKEIIIL